MHYLKEALLLPALGSGDEKVVGGVACLLSEIGQAVSIEYVFLFCIVLYIVPCIFFCMHMLYF